jgi:hypothetical protein
MENFANAIQYFCDHNIRSRSQNRKIFLKPELDPIFFSSGSGSE